MSRNPPRHAFSIPYQVDFAGENKGRHLDSTKRKITWKFGFAHPPAIFPHLFDGDEYVGYREDMQQQQKEKKIGVDCRGREHEVVLVWSLVSGKAHLYVDNRELYRHTPPSDEIFNPFTAQFQKGFNLPNSKYNGHHRIDIRCYSRTPLGAKNMIVDGYGSRFHQYDLSVDGLSYFSMPAMYELGTDKMWGKIDQWGLMRSESRASGDNCPTSEEDESGNTYATSMTEKYNSSTEQQRSQSYHRQYYGKSISNGEYKAIYPRSDSEEDRMVRIAMEASMRDVKKDHRVSTSSDQYERNSNVRQVKSDDNTPRLAVVGEDENLIDFGEDNINDLSRGVSQIAFSQHMSSDVSVLADDDATTASFMVPAHQPSRFVGQQQSFYPQTNLLYQQQPYQQQPRHEQQQPVQLNFQDPTYNPSFTSPSTPRVSGFNDAASFAYAPPPTWDDYKDAFGGSVRMDMPASVVGGSAMMSNAMMSPMSASSPMNRNTSFVPQQQQFQEQVASYGKHPVNPFGSPNHPATKANTGKNSIFDPLRSDPFAS